VHWFFITLRLEEQKLGHNDTWDIIVNLDKMDANQEAENKENEWINETYRAHDTDDSLF